MFDFGKRLRDVRQQNGLTQKQLAEKIGSDERGVRRYEAGERKPGLDVILAILDNLDVSADYLLGRSDTPQMAKGA
ncbi:MAG: helix-turn-helix transcriptional regulator [Selenomonadaceae bacterium]|nr:helix-turn-helix transcriptional regulator [Selenomonadaceae bacterium]